MRRPSMSPAMLQRLMQLRAAAANRVTPAAVNRFRQVAPAAERVMSTPAVQTRAAQAAQPLQGAPVNWKPGGLGARGLIGPGYAKPAPQPAPQPPATGGIHQGTAPKPYRKGGGVNGCASRGKTRGRFI